MVSLPIWGQMQHQDMVYMVTETMLVLHANAQHQDMVYMATLVDPITTQRDIDPVILCTIVPTFVH